MDNYFATGQARGRLLNRIRLQHSENGEPFVKFDLADSMMDSTTACKCVAVGTVAEALVSLTTRGEPLALRGAICPFVCVLPTGKEVRIDNALKVSAFQFLDDDVKPEVLPD